MAAFYMQLAAHAAYSLGPRPHLDLKKILLVHQNNRLVLINRVFNVLLLNKVMR